MGTPEFAVPSLRILHRAEYPILAVVTAADKPRGRGRKVSSTAVGEYARQNGLNLLSPVSLHDSVFLDSLRSFKPDLLVVVAFRILPPEVFRVPGIASFNLHASLLPRYRGAAPINRALMNGETSTGVTTFILAEKVDTGKIVLQTEVAIDPGDDAGSLHDRLSIVGSEAVLETVRQLESGSTMPRPQDDSLATPAPKITKDDCVIDWSKPATVVHNQIRGLSPAPSAFTMHKEKVLKIFRSGLTSTVSAGPMGTVTVGKEFLRVNTGDVQLAIEELQQEGKRRMRIDEFLRGYEINMGDKLG
jgi:methionyl-tRNA formyltransferase